MSFKDIDQDEQIELLNRRLQKLERNLNKGETNMSDVLRGAIGTNCEIQTNYYENIEGTVESIDEVWMRVSVTNKKGNQIKIIRIDDIRNITVK